MPVLIDDPTDGRTPVAPALAPAWPWLARVGLLRLSDRLSAKARGLPEGDGDAMRAFLNRPDHLTRAAMELSALDDIEGMVRAFLPPRPRDARFTRDALAARHDRGAA